MDVGVQDMPFISAKFVARYARRPFHFVTERGTEEVLTRFDVYRDRRSEVLYACGERRECYEMTTVGCAAEPVHVWIEDDFLVSDPTAADESALLEMIVDRVARHGLLATGETSELIHARLEAEYRLRATGDRGDPLHFRIELYRDQTSRELFATAERRRLYEVRRFGCGKPEHVPVWGRDDMVCRLIADIAGSSSEDMMAAIVSRIARHFRLDRVMSAKRVGRYLLAPLEIGRVGIEDDPERLDIWIDVLVDSESGLLQATAKERAVFELQPIYDESTAHVHVLVDDAVVSAVVEGVAATDPDDLAVAAGVGIGERFRA